MRGWVRTEGKEGQRSADGDQGRRSLMAKVADERIAPVTYVRSKGRREVVAFHFVSHALWHQLVRQVSAQKRVVVIGRRVHSSRDYGILADEPARVLQFQLIDHVAVQQGLHADARGLRCHSGRDLEVEGVVRKCGARPKAERGLVVDLPRARFRREEQRACSGCDAGRIAGICVLPVEARGEAEQHAHRDSRAAIGRVRRPPRKYVARARVEGEVAVGDRSGDSKRAGKL
eukprot:6069096-Prymnesium_polylepis.1